LKQLYQMVFGLIYYTINRTIKELKQSSDPDERFDSFTINRTIKELKLISFNQLAAL